MSLDAEENGLLFMETSALESTNVEVAFNNVLAGKLQFLLTPLLNSFQNHVCILN